MRSLLATLAVTLVGGLALGEQPGEKAKSDAAKVQIAELGKAVSVYYLKNDRYPESLMELVDAKLVEAGAIVDPWNKQYHYDPAGKHNDGKKPDIWTITPDKKTIGNWPDTGKNYVPAIYEGYVSGIDVIATPGKPALCLAFVSKEKPAGPDEIQVVALDGRLQSALENASARGVKVEVSYMEQDGQKVLTRVRILDRGGPGKLKVNVRLRMIG